MLGDEEMTEAQPLTVKHLSWNTTRAAWECAVIYEADRIKHGIYRDGSRFQLVKIWTLNWMQKEMKHLHHMKHYVLNWTSFVRLIVWLFHVFVSCGEKQIS